MRRYWKICIVPAVFLLVLAMLNRNPGWDAPEGLSAARQRSIQRVIAQAAEVLDEAPGADTDAREELLIAAGYPTLDTDAIYPEYLANPDDLTDFWEGRTDSFGMFRLLEDGEARYVCFLREKEGSLFFTAHLARDELGDLIVREAAIQPVYEMELADWGIFYYRLYRAGDPHYIDYAQIRLQPPNREAYDLSRKYILPVGYQMVNLFLCDWQEGSWGALSFHDLLEALYQRETGEELEWEGFPNKGSPARRRIPGALFEEAILPYFQISREEFRDLCLYDPEEDTYPWRPIHGDDLTGWKYPMCEPEVVSWQENSDGTLTLEVQVYSPELKTDRLFCHVLTVRPLQGDAFQYASNRVTYVSERGLPPAMARFALDGTE